MRCIEFHSNRVAIGLQCIEINTYYYRVNPIFFSVEEFDEEIEGQVHQQHHLLSCLDLSTEGQYSVHNEDPTIYSDSEEDTMPQAWLDLVLPTPPSAADVMPPSIKQQLIRDMMSQHDTACKVLDRMGINACKEHQKSFAVAVLARVRKGNTLCSICGHSFNSTQPLRTHIQGQHLEATHLKCKKCDYSAGDSYSLSIHARVHDPKGKKFKCNYAGCKRAYNTKGHLNEYQKSHQLGRSPPCPHCGKDFSGMYGLKCHLLSCAFTPGGAPEKQFQCEVCNKSYYWQSELTRHQKSKNH